MFPNSLELPEVDSRRCTGCGDCVVVCPVNCLAMREGLPELARPRDCIACALCAAICPADAIRMAAK